jgi:hypothetical protein
MCSISKVGLLNLAQEDFLERKSFIDDYYDEKRIFLINRCQDLRNVYLIQTGHKAQPITIIKRLFNVLMNDAVYYTLLKEKIDDKDNHDEMERLTIYMCNYIVFKNWLEICDSNLS